MGEGYIMNGKMKATAVVIRSYNNPNVTKAVKRFLDMGVGKIHVVVNAAPDKGATHAFLSEVSDNRLVILDMEEGYSWSNALNLSLMSLHIGNAGGDGIRYVFNVSVEALFESRDVEAMLDAITDEPETAVVGTSFEGRQDGNVADLGRSYNHPRNTGMLLSLKTLGDLWCGFDAWCDAAGGMEDIDFILRTRALSSRRVVMLDLRVKIILGKHYHQGEKEKREQAAMDQIIARWRALFKLGSPERKRIDEVISQMRIASGT